MDLDEIFIKCLKWDKEQSVKNTMLMVGFQSPGIILWSRHSIGGLSCLGGGLCSLSALVSFGKGGGETGTKFQIILEPLFYKNFWIKKLTGKLMDKNRTDTL